MSEEERLREMIAVPPSPPSITVDYTFELLQQALNAVVESHGDKAKAIAWDIKSHFLEKIGSMRSGAVRVDL